MHVWPLIVVPPLVNGFLYSHYTRALVVQLDIHHTGLRVNGQNLRRSGPPFVLSLSKHEWALGARVNDHREFVLLYDNVLHLDGTPDFLRSLSLLFPPAIQIS